MESRITSAITCLEALYLKSKERDALTHRLSQRAALVLGLLEVNPIKAYHTLASAYNIRSTYIHGSEVDKDQHKTLGKLAERTLDYARRSLLIALMTRESIDKDGLITLIDTSLLDTQSYVKLKTIVDATRIRDIT